MHLDDSLDFLNFLWPHNFLAPSLGSELELGSQGILVILEDKGQDRHVYCLQDSGQGGLLSPHFSGQPHLFQTGWAGEFEFYSMLLSKL